MFLLSRSTTRGALRSAGVSRFIAMPLRLTGPHHSRRGPPPPSFYIERGTRVLRCGLAPRAWVRRSPGYLPVVVQLDAVLDPGVPALRSSLARSPHGLRLHGGDRHFPKIHWFSGLCVRFRATPFTSLRSLVLLPAFAFGRYTTERLTRPYSGGLARLRRVPSRQATIARLPHAAGAELLQDLIVGERPANHDASFFLASSTRSRSMSPSFQYS